MESTQLEANVAYWEHGYPAENVDHPVFRFYGRILKVDGPTSGKLLDFGCGGSAAPAFFLRKGYDAYGVDVSSTDLAYALKMHPELKERVERIEPLPSPDDRWFGGDFDIITSIQVLYYLGDNEMEDRLWSLSAQLRPDGLFYATMIGTASWYWTLSEPAQYGMRKVTLPEGRLGGVQYCRFVESHEELRHLFHMFEPIHEGYYTEKYRSDEGPGYHFTFVGRPRKRR